MQYKLDKSLPLNGILRNACKKTRLGLWSENFGWKIPRYINERLFVKISKRISDLVSTVIHVTEIF